MIKDEQIQDVADFCFHSQERICSMLEVFSAGTRFGKKSWDHKEAGGGVYCILRGEHIEKAGVNVSKVSGSRYPGEEINCSNRAYTATGLSTITHGYSPHVPISHMNVRFIRVGDDSWFGGGADLTPFIVYDEDKERFHNEFKKVCEEFRKGSYSEFTKWCDQYFYIPHRKSIRGVGGVFFDRLQGDFKQVFEFIKNVVEAYISTCSEIIEKRLMLAYTVKQKEEQLYWRGRYAEFNLIYDRGTKFGLSSGGCPEAIFASLPPEVKW